MLFRRIIIAAVFAGICAGIFLTILQNMRLLEIILEAEKYETPAQSLQHRHAANESIPDIGRRIWAPQDGSERLSYTLLVNIIAAVGFSAILISLMSLSERQGVLRSGLLWGLAGFSVFFLSPSLGLPPELPGMQGADLTQRQTWWLMAVISTAAGLACIAFADRYYKILGVGLLVIPHIVGAPRHSGAAFSHPDAAVVVSLQSLHGQFIQLAAVVNLSYWLVLGLLCAYIVKKYVTAHPTPEIRQLVVKK